MRGVAVFLRDVAVFLHGVAVFVRDVAVSCAVRQNGCTVEQNICQVAGTADDRSRQRARSGGEEIVAAERRTDSPVRGDVAPERVRDEAVRVTLQRNACAVWQNA